MEISEIVRELKNPESKVAARVILKLLCNKEVLEHFLKDLKLAQADGKAGVILKHMENLAQCVEDNFILEDGHASIY